MGAPRYPPGPRPGGVRMPQGIGNEFNGVSSCGSAAVRRELVAQKMFHLLEFTCLASMRVLLLAL